MLIPERIVSKIHVVPCGGCWQWEGATIQQGYGHVQWDGKPRRAHRLLYELMVGVIPDGLEIDHLCRNRACVNPTHMEPVTHAENLRRAGAHRNLDSYNDPRRAMTHCHRGHEFTPENTRVKSGGSRDCRACARLHRAKWRAKQRRAVKGES